MKNNRGSITIEASIALVVFMMFILAFLTIGKYSEIQNRVKHSLNQTAITLSLVNNQYSQFAKTQKSLSGITANELAEIVGYFDEKAGNAIASSLHSPYTGSISDITGKSKSNSWTEADLQTEILRYFAYYYIGGDISKYKAMSKSEIESLLGKNGLKDIKISSGDPNGKIISSKILYIEFKYSPDAGISAYSFFGRDKGPEFTDSVKLVLMK